MGLFDTIIIKTTMMYTRRTCVTHMHVQYRYNKDACDAIIINAYILCTDLHKVKLLYSLIKKYNIQTYMVRPNTKQTHKNSCYNLIYIAKFLSRLISTLFKDYGLRVTFKFQLFQCQFQVPCRYVTYKHY